MVGRVRVIGASTLFGALVAFATAFGQPTGATSPEDAEAPRRGEKVYQARCRTCHAKGLAGAPVVGDREAWQYRIAQGIDVLVERSIEGFRGARGFMPPKGGEPSLSRQEVEDAVRYMVEASR